MFRGRKFSTVGLSKVPEIDVQTLLEMGYEVSEIFKIRNFFASEVTVDFGYETLLPYLMGADNCCPSTYFVTFHFIRSHNRGPLISSLCLFTRHFIPKCFLQFVSGYRSTFS